MIRKLIVLAAFLAIAIGSNKAQELGVMGNPSPPGQQDFFSADSITVGIINTDFTGTFQGQVSVFLGVEDQFGVISVVDSEIVVLNLAPQTFEFVSFTNIYDPSIFSLGGNTVVIWPEAPPTPTSDSLRYNLFMQDAFASQPDSMGIEQNTSMLPSSVNVNQIDTLKVNIENRSRSFLTGGFKVKIGRDTSNNGEIDVLDSLLISDDLKPYDSYELEIPQTFGLNNYILGGNTVVIWPEAPNTLTEDSLFFNITVQFPDGLLDLPGYELEPVLTVFPNPAQGHVEFLLDGQKTKAEEVIIYNAKAQQIRSFYNTSSAELGELKAGIYFLEIRLPENRFRTFRLIKN